MSDWEEGGSNETGAQGAHWAQGLLWGIFLSILMFGLGFLAGSRWGEQRAAEKAPVFVTRLLPPAVEIRPPGPEEVSPTEEEPSGSVWGILTGQESPSFPPNPASGTTKPKPPDPPAKAPTPPLPQSVSQSPAIPNSTPLPPPAVNGTRPGTARYSLQIVSVQTREKAEAIVKDMNGKGYPVVRIVPAEVPGRGTWYRIRVGSFDKKEDAEALARQLREKERLQPQLVSERS